MSLPTGSDVANLLGRGADGGFVAQAHVAAQMQYAFAKAYTRGRGFEDDNDLPSDLRVVVITSAARLATNATMLKAESAESYGSQGNFEGSWSPTELAVLNRYRVRAA